jgi:nitrite reductase (NADH) large subunit
MSDDDLICICMTVSRGEIKQAIRDGHTTIDALKSTLFCCTGCGTCEPRVQAILDEELKARAAEEMDKPA